METDKAGKKHCKSCDMYVTKDNFSRHTKSNRHLNLPRKVRTKKPFVKPVCEWCHSAYHPKSICRHRTTCKASPHLTKFIAL